MTGYKPNPDAVRMLERATSTMEYMRKRAEDAAGSAKRFAPVLTGDYKNSIQASVEIVEGKATGLVFATDFKAVWIEVGTETIQASAPLRKGAELSGLKVMARR